MLTSASYDVPTGSPIFPAFLSWISCQVRAQIPGIVGGFIMLATNELITSLCPMLSKILPNEILLHIETEEKISDFHLGHLFFSKHSNKLENDPKVSNRSKARSENKPWLE